MHSDWWVELYHSLDEATSLSRNFVRTILALAVLSLGTAIMAHAGPTNLVQNGSFETGNFQSWTLSGDTAHTGVCSDGACPNPGGWMAEDGIYSAYFGTVGDYSYLSQNIATVPGDTYTLSFYLADPQGGTPNYFAVQFGNTTFSFSNFGQPFGWQQFVFVTTATSNISTLKFTFRQDPNYFFLDNVVINHGNQTPEPGTLALFGTGLVGIAGVVRRKLRG